MSKGYQQQTAGGRGPTPGSGASTGFDRAAGRGVPSGATEMGQFTGAAATDLERGQVPRHQLLALG
jgi:hypothetical protein